MKIRHILWLYLYTVVYKWPIICCIGWQVQRSSHQLVIIITMCPSDGDIYLHWNPLWRFWWMTYQYGNSGNDVAICRVANITEHDISLHIKLDIWHPAVGLRCRNPPRHLIQLEFRTIPLTQTPSEQELCHSEYIFHGISNTTKCNQIWAQNNAYIFTCNYQCLYLSI